MEAEAGKVDWSGCVIAVVGGDRREQEIARLAAATGATVRAFGFKKFGKNIEEHVFFFDETNDAVANFYEEYKEIPDNFFDNWVSYEDGYWAYHHNMFYSVYNKVNEKKTEITEIIENIIYRYNQYLSVPVKSLYVLLNLYKQKIENI